MRRVYKELELGDFESVRPAIEQYFAGQKDYKTNRYQMTPELRAEITRRWAQVHSSSTATRRKKLAVGSRQWAVERPGCELTVAHIKAWVSKSSLMVCPSKTHRAAAHRNHRTHESAPACRPGVRV